MPKMITYASAYAPLAPGSFVIESNIYDGLDLMEFLGHPATPMDVYITIASGVVVQSNTAGKAAISAKGLPAGSTVTLNNLGFIIGAGGRGASRYDAVESGPYWPESGQPGGDAIYSSVPISIANAFGYIWGGGGGGGGMWTKDGYGNTNLLYDRFYGGGGGAGRGPLGGGERGVCPGNENFCFDATPFVSVHDAGRGGITSLANSSSSNGGGYGEGGRDAFTSAGVRYDNSADGVGFGGPPGWAVNTPAGVPITWLDTMPLPSAQLKGRAGNRLIQDMDYRARIGNAPNISIGGDTANFNLFEALGSPTTPLAAFVVIETGVTVYSTSPTVPAFTTEKMPVGSTLFLKLRGRIIGRGGTGGTDPVLAEPSTIYPEQGRHGGDALRLTVATKLSLALSLAYDPYCGILGGGGGGGLVRLFPLDGGESIGGQAGAGGGAGGKGTAGWGSSMPVFNAAESQNSANAGTLVLNPVDYSAYTDSTAFKCTTGKGGSYGHDGQASSVVLNTSSTNVLESHPGGLGGWAINSTQPVQFGSEFSAKLSSAGSTIDTMIRGKSTVGIPAAPAKFGLGNVIATRPALSYTAPAPASRIYLLNPRSGTRDYKIHDALGNPTTAKNVFVHVGADQVIGATTTSKGAISTRGMPPGSTVRLYLAGIVAGCGGDGGSFDGHDPAAIPNLAVGLASRIGNGKNGGPAIENSLGGNFTYIQLTSVVSGTTTSAVHPALLAGGGGGPAYFTCEYYGTAGNWQYNPSTVRLGYGGGGGAGGGKGGAGIYGGGGDGVCDPMYTSSGRWNDNRGLGPTLVLLRATNPRPLSQQVGNGGYYNTAAVSDFLTPGNIYNQEKMNNDGSCTSTKLQGILACGSPGQPGATVLAV